MQEIISKAKVLIEALPYIKRFWGKTVVVKYGGAAMIDAKLKDEVMQDLVLMKYVGMKPVVVHGGGPEINRAMEQFGKKPEFVEGRRVTDQATMEIIEMVLSGKVNKEIVAALQRHGGAAVGLSGKDGGLLSAEKMKPTGRDLGFVGVITQVEPRVIHAMNDENFIPVIAPVAMDSQGQAYNINADDAAAEVAVALKADKLVLLTDVPGLLADPQDPRTLISTLKLRDIEGLTAQGVIKGGMLPKVQACARALKGGVGKIHIIDGRISHALLLEIFTDQGIGTEIISEGVKA